MSVEQIVENSYLRVAANIALVLLIPILVYFNSQLNSSNNRLTSIEVKMEQRYEERETQLRNIETDVQDHETRLRFIEREPLPLNGPRK